MSLDRILPYFPPPIQALLTDETVNEIMYNGDGSVWCEQAGILRQVADVPVDPVDLEFICQTIARLISKDVNSDRPRLNARLADGSRVAAMLPPVSQHGPTMTIRKFSKRRFTFDGLVAIGSIRPEGVEILRGAISGQRNILFSGQPGAGKTSLLNTCLNCVHPDTRIGILEDTAEIRIDLPNVTQWEAREAEQEAVAVTMRQLVKDALRQRFDILAVGETRDESAYDLLQALNTGHQGSMSTIHANSPEDALTRLVDLALSAAENLSERGLMRLVGRLIHVVVQVVRSQGKRYVSEIIRVNRFDTTKGQFETEVLYRH